MSLDVAALLAVCAGALGGALAGLVRLAVPLVAAGLAALLARPLGAAAGGGLRAALPNPAMASPVAAALAFAAVFLIVTLALRLMLRGSLRRLATSPVNRALGALAGGAQAALAAWLVASLLVLWGRPVERPPFRLDPAEGDLAALARDHNLLVRGAGPAKGASPLRLLQERGAVGPLERAREAAEAVEQTYRSREEMLEKAAK